jgi:hypothetical protein
MLVENVKMRTHTRAAFSRNVNHIFGYRRGTFDATTYEWNSYVGRCDCGVEFAGRGGWRLCGTSSSLQNMSAENHGKAGNLLSTGAV